MYHNYLFMLGPQNNVTLESNGDVAVAHTNGKNQQKYHAFGTPGWRTKRNSSF